MCGIVGYIGRRNAQDILLNSLARLEYRGYDSAGIVTLSNSEIVGDSAVGIPAIDPTKSLAEQRQPEPATATLVREKGKIAELAKLVAANRNRDHIGIGHTRWATHGAPSVANAHPHQAGKIFLVHNGIIENYLDIKKKLADFALAQGEAPHVYSSETDSEVLAALIEYLYKGDLLSAVTDALQLVKGTYGIAVVCEDNPNEMIVARSGSPLIIGVGIGETIVASDATAILGSTNQAIYLNDGEIARVTTEDIDLFNLNAQPLSPEVETIEADLQAIQKDGFDHFLIKEIFEQPDCVRSVTRGRVDPVNKTVKLGGINLTNEQLRDIEHIVIVGCGTAYYAGLLASYYLEQIVDDVTVEVVIASEYRYKSSFIPEKSVAIIVSQSGETADSLACMREIQARGIHCLGVINTVGSTIARESDGGVYVHAGPEISVASTKAFTSQTVAMLMFGIMIAQTKSINPKQLSRYVNELIELPDEISGVLAEFGEVGGPVDLVAREFADFQHSFYLGRDTCYPVALEGALKLKEVSYINASGIAAGELKHGPIALIDDRFFEMFCLTAGDLFEKSVSGISEVNARGGNIVALTNSDQPIDAAHVIRIDSKLDLLAPILLNVLQQLFAYFLTVAKGLDVDQPRNLAKSVTVE